jgi:hypothetical protein
MILAQASIVGFVALFFGCAHGVGVSVKSLYTSSAFSGRDFTGARISVCPVLVGGVSSTSGNIDPAGFREALRETRPDLPLIMPSEFKNHFLGSLGLPELRTLSELLWKSEILALKSADALWDAIGTPYLLVFRLTSGASVTRIDRQTSRRITLECELWDTDDREVVWRSVARTRTMDARLTDSELMSLAAAKLVRSLPAVQPGYERGEW